MGDDQKRVIGNMAQVRFPSFGNKQVDGKVDTGATMTSLHAEDIKISSQSRQVQFLCLPLSQNVITLDLVSTQEVHSADAGGVSRPVVKLDLVVDGVAVADVAVNLNDRSNMDVPLLLGQNVLKAGNFIIDPQKDQTPIADLRTEGVDDTPPQDVDAILRAMDVLVENNVTLKDLVLYMQTAAVNKIKDNA